MSILDNLEGTEIAIIGLAGRFPNSRDLAEFWRNLRDGVECVRPLTEAELDALGVDAALRADPNYVKVSSHIEGYDLFDAPFFDYTPREAEIMDPQQRIFLETCWEAMEHAGHDPQQYPGLIGVFAGGTTSNYMVYNLAGNRELFSAIDHGQIDIGNGADFIATRVSYKLNLKGPSFSVQTACSTSLVAVHLACQALLNEECDMALAGGVCIHVDHPKGYRYVEGSILTPDGHTRAFDADAAGTVFGSGAGVVVLKRLEDALNDGDHIHAIIRGSAVGNDGSGKVGFVAPSVEGQAEVITEALSVAAVDPATIQYVETHGAGTRLGDPIEMRAITKAFRTGTNKVGYCDIGSVKTNIGHLTGAAGVAGLIKTVLSLENKQIPPTLNYTAPNPEIDFANSPFVPNTQLKEWRTTNGAPRRAGVSSFGLGGTNAHVVLEEMPPLGESEPSRAAQLLVLSAKTDSALQQMTTNLVAYLRANPHANLADVAFTLQVGRQPFSRRRAVVCHSVAEAIALLQANEPSRVLTRTLGRAESRPIAFLLPSAETIGVNSGRPLFESESVFREAVATCADILRPHLAADLTTLLYPDDEEATGALAQTAVAYAAAFTVEYATAQLWQSWGIEPEMVFGVGVGEWVAACLAGSVSLEDALALVAANGRLATQANGPQMLGRLVAGVEYQEPTLRVLSSLSGDWLTAEQATDAAYYAGLLTAPHQTEAALKRLAQDPKTILLEVGVGDTLSQAALAFKTERSVMVASWPGEGDLGQLLTALAHLWLTGLSVDWAGFSADEKRRRLALPTYPFERKRYWIEPSAKLELPTAKLEKKQAVEEWLYAPTWRSVPPARPTKAWLQAEQWLIFVDDLGLGVDLAISLQGLGQQISVVKAGDEFIATGPGEFTINPAEPAHYDALLQALDSTPDHILHLWGLTEPQSERGAPLFERSLGQNFYSLLYLGRALGKRDLETVLPIEVLSNFVYSVTDDEVSYPEKTAVLGACLVVPQEYVSVACRFMDVTLTGNRNKLVDALLAEFRAPITETALAVRGSQRWVSGFTPTPLSAEGEGLRPLRNNGVYLITGGLTDIGLDLGKQLAQSVQANLILLDRPGAISKNQSLDPAQTEAALLALGASGVLALHLDLTDAAQLSQAVQQGVARFGAIHGVIHAPTVASDRAFRTIEEADPASCQWHFGPKVYGLWALEQAIAGLELDFCVVNSALSVALGGLGFAAFTAAAFTLDALAHQRDWLSIDWDVWQFGDDLKALTAVTNNLSQLALTPAEGGEVLRRVLASATTSQTLVSTGDLALRQAQSHQRTEAMRQSAHSTALYERPDIWTEYVAPRNETEQQVVEIWQKVLGINPIGVNDNFFDLGGHSLLATQLRNQIYELFQVELPLQNLLENATAAGIAQLIAAHQPDEETAKPIRERLKEAFPAERPLVLEKYLRQKLAGSLNVPVNQLPADGNLKGYNLQLPTVDLMWNLKRDFKAQFYPHEILGRPSIPDMAQFILYHVDRMDNLASFATDKPLSAYTVRAHRKEHTAKQRLVAPAQKNKSMVFVLSGPRSGSTLLRVMLAGHPQIFCPPEIALLFFEDMQEWQKNVSFGQDFQWPAEGLHWALVELLGLEPDEGWRMIEQMVKENRSVQSVYAQIQEKAGDKLVVDKTPPYAMDVETLHRAELLFENPKYVYLVRHPYSMMDSFLKVRLDQQFSSSLFEEANPDPFVIAETIWSTANRNVSQFLANIDPSRQFLMRYEDMVRDPIPMMRNLAEFMGIPYDSRLVNPYDGRRERMMGGIGDPNILQHTTIDPKLGEVWKHIKLPRRLDPSTKALAAQFKYELPDNLEIPQANNASFSVLNPPETAVADVNELSNDEVAAMLSKLLAEQDGQ